MLASPADVGGVDAPVLDLWRDDVLSTSTADKVALALELEAAVRAADPLVRGVESASYGDAAVEAAVANSLGVEASTRRTDVRRARRSRWRARARSRRPGTASRPVAASPSSTPHEAARDAAERAVRLLGAAADSVGPAPGGARSARDPLAARAARRRAQRARRSSRAARCSSGREGEEVAGPGITLVDDPTLARGVRRRDPRRRGRADASGRAHRRRAASTRFLHNVYTARRAGARDDGLGGARRLQVAARRRRPRAAPRAR